MTSPQTIASYFTLAGRAVPFEEPEKEVSPHSLEARARAAARAGFAGMGISYPDLCAITEVMTFSEIRSIFDDAGLPLLELECIVDWHANGARLEASNAVRRLLLDCAAAIGACHIKVAGDQFGEETDHAHLARSFRGLCDDAAVVGTKIVIEHMPWSDIRDVHDAVRLVSDAGADNGGVLIDLWHLARAGTSVAEIAAVPPETLGYVEICDALLEPEGTLKEDTINHRRLCGEGQLDVEGFAREVKAKGYAGPWGVEVISHSQRERSVRAAATLAHDSAVGFITSD